MAIKLKVHEDKIKLKVGQGSAIKLRASEGIPIYPEYYTGDYEVTPTESEQSLATSGLMMSDDVSVHAVPSDYVGSAIDRRSSTDLTASGATVSVPSGYYEENASKSVQSGSVATPTGGITADPTISVDSSGLITASVSKSESISPIVNEGYVTSGTAGTITFSGSATSQLSTQAGETVTPTESVQTAVGAEKFTTGAVKVGAIPSDYVGSGITQRSSADLSASGDTVTAPSGYYAESASKSVASGSATTPATSITANPTISVDSSTGLISASVSASKSVTPTVSAGYVSSGSSGTVSVSGSNTEQLSTQAGATITPTTSEQTAVSAGKFTLGDVKVSAMPTGSRGNSTVYIGQTSTDMTYTVKHDNATSGYYEASTLKTDGVVYLHRQTETVTPSETAQTVTPTGTTYYLESVAVDAIPSDYVGSGITQRSSTDLTASGATVTAPSGYYAENATKTIASGSATPAASISATGAGKTVGNGTITLTKSAVSNTPQVTAGYISSGTAGNTSVSLTASVTTQAGQTYHPSTTDQSVAANTYVLGAQTFNAVTTTNLTAENIKDGVTVKIGDSTDDDCVTSVTGSYTGGGANLQAKTNIDPTTSSQTITADTGYDGLSSVQINAMPSGTEGTPTATKGTVNNHAISVTPSVTNVAGYISGGTHNGTAVSVSASELVSGTKSISANGTGIDVTNYASVDVSVSGGAPVLETVTKTYTPTTSQQTETITPSTGYDGIGEVDVTVNAMPSGTEGTPTATKGAVTSNSVSVTPSVTNTAGYISGGTHTGTAVSVSASELVSGTVNITSSGNTDVTNYATASVASGSATASATKGAVSNHSITVTPSVTRTAGYITAGTASGTAVTVSASELVSGTVNITSSGNTDVTNYATASVASGSATASATKGAVSNHSVSVTPSVTRTAGYVTAGTASGTAVTVSASELVSGSQTITNNGTVDVTNLAQVVVSVEGGGGSGMTVATANTTLASANASIQFTGLSGEPTSFVVTTASDLATGASPYKTAAVVFDGSDLHGQIVTNTSNANASYSTSFTKSYSNGTLTITGTGTNFQANQYKLVYTYGGTSANIGTAETQVGSGATSVAFTGLTDEPDYFSVIFKSDFGTSSGYQRVMSVAYDGTNTYGVAMDSGAKVLSSWSYTYNNGTLTVSSQGTNNGGYFHQPGYYQLTYGVGGTVEPTEIEVEPLSVTTNGTYTAPTGKAYSPVTVNVSGGGSVQYDTKTATASNYPVSLEFTSMKGEPKAFVLRLNAQVSSSGSTTYYYIVDIAHFGTTTHGNCFRIGSTRRVDNITSGYSYTYSGTTLTITSSASSRSASPGAFYNGSYELLYAY